MHRVLYVEEILCEIFSYLDFLPRRRMALYPWEPERRSSSQRDIITLTRTCRAFKEPALDILWAYLEDLSPLIRCRPEASSTNSDGDYLFHRRLKQADWDIILGYARRVRDLPHLCGSCGLAVGSFEELSKPPSSTSLVFPMLRCLGLYSPNKGISCFVPQLINPRLARLYFDDAVNLGTSIGAFGEGCPNLKSFHINTWTNPDAVSSLICHWQNLYSVDCIDINLNGAALSHLSHLPNLDYLRFTLHNDVVEWIQSSQSGTFMLTFPTLRTLSLRNVDFRSSLGFFHHLRLPIIDSLAVSPCIIPTEPDLMSCLTKLQESCTHGTLRDFTLVLSEFAPESDSEAGENSHRYHITFDHLHPLTIFMNIQSIIIDLCCGVDLNECDLLCFAASWPNLERFCLCDEWHWTESSGITPVGFVQLLERCRSLKSLYFKFNTRGYIETPQGHPWRGLRMPEGSFFHLLNSPIEEESIHALGVFFHVAPYPNFQFSTHWNDPDFQDSRISEELCEVYYNRWEKVQSLARRLSEERRNLRHSLDHGSIQPR